MCLVGVNVWQVRYGHGAAAAGAPGSRPVSDDLTAENTSSTALMVDRLQINVDYKFFVRAYTSKGPGPWSNGLPFRTLGQCQRPAACSFKYIACPQKTPP